MRKPDSLMAPKHSLFERSGLTISRLTARSSTRPAAGETCPSSCSPECAEAQAIRKGWPEDLSNTFVGEEIEQAALILIPARAAEGATRERLERIGGHGAPIIN